MTLEVADRIAGQNSTSTHQADEIATSNLIVLPYHLPVFYLDRIQSPLLCDNGGLDSITFIIPVPIKGVRSATV
jgi:hypothetical protein